MICAVVALLLLAVIAQQVLTSGPLVAFDHRVNEALNGLRKPADAWIFTAISTLSSSTFATLLCLALTILLWAVRRRAALLPLWLVYAGVLLSIGAIKSLVGRVRPEPLEGIVLTSASFPSGNAAIAAALYGFLAYLLVRELRGKQARSAVVVGAIALVGLFAFSRLYLAVHYLSDVVAGALLGGLWAVIGMVLVQVIQRKGRTLS